MSTRTIGPVTELVKAPCQRLVKLLTGEAARNRGEVDHRTPIAESEQYYQALKLRRVETVLVRIPGASHHISARPSHLIAKVAHVLKWFDDHGGATK